MVRLILVGTFIVAAALTLLLVVSLVVIGNDYVLSRVLIGVAILIFLLCIAFCLHKGRVRLAAWMLIVLYSTVATSILWIWGVNSPIGILMLCFVVLLAAVTLGAKSILYVTVFLAIILVMLETLVTLKITQPDVAKLDDVSSFGDIISYIIIFSIFALIAWISVRRTELAFKKAQDAESALLKEKASLAIRLARRTVSLRNAQLEEMKNLYRFAELGQLTTATLHELANHLSVLSIDIDSGSGNKNDDKRVARLRESVSYIDMMIRQVREQLTDSAEVKSINLADLINKTIHMCTLKLGKSKINVTVSLPSSKNLTIHGDPVRLSQSLNVLITNAIQASLELPPNKRSDILVKLESIGHAWRIHVIDHGIGIPKEKRKGLFEPKRSTKEHGLGIGLFIAKQIIETHFHGKLYLQDATEKTQFTIQIPKSFSKP